MPATKKGITPATLDEIYAKLEKQLDVTVHSGSETEDVYRLPGVSPNFNRATEGGIPFGRWSQFWGNNRAGKTTIAYQMIAQAQRVPHSIEDFLMPQIRYYREMGETARVDRLEDELTFFKDRFPDGLICCVTGDTLVAVADGRNAVPIRELAESGDPVDVYASDDGRTVVKKMHPRKTRDDAEILKVKLDDGTDLRCTPDHKLMLWNGSYKRADEVVSGDSLMRFDSMVDKSKHRRNIWMGPRPKTGASPVFKDGGWLHQAILVAGGPFEKGVQVHHIDEDSLNDLPSNLIPMGNGSHQRMHMLKRIANLTDEQKQAWVDRGKINGKKRWEGLSAEERSEFARQREAEMGSDVRGEMTRQAWAKKSKEERSEIFNRIHEGLGPEGRSERSKRGRASMTPEARSATGTKSAETLGPEGTEERSRKAMETMGPQVFHDRAVKAWVTRRKNQEDKKREAGRNNHTVVSVDPVGKEDVYCGEVEDVHNFSVITSVKGDDFKSADFSGITIHNCLYNAEQIWDKKRAQKLGVDTDALKVVESTMIEDVMGVAEATYGAVHMHVIDSTTNCTSYEEQKMEMTDRRRGLDARVWKQTIRKSLNYWNHPNGRGSPPEDFNIGILITQSSVNQRTQGEQPVSARFIGHTSAMTLHFQLGRYLWRMEDGRLKEDKPTGADDASLAGRAEPDGRQVFIEVEKSRVGRLGRIAALQSDFRTGAHDVLWELTNAAIHFGIAAQSGSTYRVDGDEKSCRGMGALRARIDEDPALQDRIQAALMRSIEDD